MKSERVSEKRKKSRKIPLRGNFCDAPSRCPIEHVSIALVIEQYKKARGELIGKTFSRNWSAALRETLIEPAHAVGR